MVDTKLNAEIVTKKKRKSMFDEMNHGILCSADMKNRKNKVFYWLIVSVLIVYCLIVFVPCIWLMLSGFKDASELYAKPSSFFPKKFEITKFTEAFKELRFYKYYWNTFMMAAVAVIFDIVFNGMAGYVLSRLKPKGSKLIMGIVFVLMMLPANMSTVPLYMTFRDFPYLHINMLESYWPIWFMAGANTFNILLFKSSFDGISNSLVEAAKIDGASNFRIFLQIMVPLSLPVIMTVAIFTFNGQFGNFFWPYLLISDNAKAVLGIKIYQLKSSNLTMDYQMLCILFSILPQLIIYVFLQKYIIGGINVGGVKG